MKKRTITLIIIFSVLGIILLISALNSEFVSKDFGCLIGCTDGLCLDFGDGNGTCLGCTQYGFKCDTKCLNCTWYPLFFGCIDGVPTCFGISCETGGVAPENGFWVSEGVLNTQVVYKDAQEDVDYTIESISYTITTPEGSYTATTFDEMISCELVRNYNYIDGLNDKNVYITIEINIDAASSIEDLSASTTLYFAGIYEVMLGGESKTYQSYPNAEAVTGKSSIEINIKLDGFELGELKRLEALTVSGKVGKYEISGVE